MSDVRPDTRPDGQKHREAMLGDATQLAVGDSVAHDSQILVRIKYQESRIQKKAS